ncbi:hypothetical protein Tco_0245675 [Tanacetum coccineum]
MGYLVRAYYSISPTRYYKDDSCWSVDLKSKVTEDIISIGSFMEVLVLNHYVLVRKILDSLPSDNIVDFPLMENINENRTLIRRYPEAFLCIVGLSHSFVDTDVRLTLRGLDNDDMSLLDFVKSADPFKVKVEERTFGKGEVHLLTETAYMVFPPFAQTIHLVNHTLVDELRESTGKKKIKVSLNAGPPPVNRARASGIPNVGSGSAAPDVEEFVSSSVTPTPDHECQDESDSAQDVNVRTRHTSERYVELSSCSEPLNTDVNTSPRVGSPNPHIQCEIENVVVGPDNEVGATSIPGNDTRATPVYGNEVVASSLPGNEAVTSSLPGNKIRTSSSVPIDGSPIDVFFDSQTIDYSITQDIYVLHWDVTNDSWLDDLVMCRNLVDYVSPLGYWASLHNRHDSNFLDLLNVTSSQHVCMLSKLCLHYEYDILTMVGGEASGVSELRKRVSELEAEAVARSEEVVSLTSQNTKLLGKVSGLESVREELRNQLDGDGRLVTAFATECRAALGNVILMAINKGIQKGLEAGIEHGKAGRSLDKVEAYDFGVETDGLRDPNSISHEILLSDALGSSHDHAEKRKAGASSSSVAGGPSVFVPAQDSSLVVADYQISSVAIGDDAVPSYEPHNDLFDTTVMDKTVNY